MSRRANIVYSSEGDVRKRIVGWTQLAIGLTLTDSRAIGSTTSLAFGTQRHFLPEVTSRYGFSLKQA